MRQQFIQSLVQASREDTSTFLMIGDLGFGVIEPFAQEFPERFLNAGVAEQNMLGMAAGLAFGGKSVFVYSIANFPSLRALEQIRNDIAHHNYPVFIVSVGAGMAYGTLGYSHHAVEDLAVMRAIPNLDIYSPADDLELAAIVSLVLKKQSPAYIRIGKGGERRCHNAIPRQIEKGIPLGSARGEVLVLSTGAITRNTIDAIAHLHGEDSSRISHYSIPVVSSLELSNLKAKSLKGVITVEEHSLTGGFGSAVLEKLSDAGMLIPTLRIGLSAPEAHVGSHAFLQEKNSLHPEGIARQIQAFVKGLDSK